MLPCRRIDNLLVNSSGEGMAMGRFLASGLLLIAMLLVWPVYAQKMYRCGSQYQDRPCDAGQKSKTVGSTGVGASANTPSGDPQCAQRGKDALKIVWSREGGATQERLLSDATNAEAKQLVIDVYRRRGSAAEVQAAVEADCVVQKEKQERADALATAAARAQKEAGIQPAAPAAAPAPVSDPNAGERARQERAALEEKEKKRTCAGLHQQMEDLRAQERVGGSTGTMEALRGQRRRLQSQTDSNGC
jgi:hypothetical protein